MCSFASLVTCLQQIQQLLSDCAVSTLEQDKRSLIIPGLPMSCAMTNTMSFFDPPKPMVSWKDRRSLTREIQPIPYRRINSNLHVYPLGIEFCV